MIQYTFSNNWTIKKYYKLLLADVLIKKAIRFLTSHRIILTGSTAIQ